MSVLLEQTSEVAQQLQRGEIWMVDLGDRQGSIMSGYRPCIVISNWANNRYAPTANVIPITSQVKQRKIPVHVHIPADPQSGLSVDSVALPEQICTITKEYHLVKRLGRLSVDKLREVVNGVLIQIEHGYS